MGRTRTMKTCIWRLILISAFMASLPSSCRAESTVVFDEVYDGEHFRDVLFSANSGQTLRHAVLVLYAPACRLQVESWRMLHETLKLPDDFYLYFSIHDYETTQKYTWYNWGPAENLTHWFNMTSACSLVLFLPKGSTDKTIPITLKDNDDFVNWLWRLVKTKVTLINEASENVVFSFHGQYEDILDVTVSPGHEKVVEAYTSYILSATGEAGFYGGWTVGFTPRNFTAHMATNTMSRSLFESDQLNMMARRRGRLDKDVWDYADRHLLNRKQPLLVGNFTVNGYEKLQMPEWLKHQLREFYDEQVQFRVPEQWEPGMTAINMENHRCGMVHLDNATKTVVASGIRPLLEEWSNCELTMTAFYGIREYYKGHRLKNHVDRLGTHVISVILQITQDLGGGPDWELEVITYKGDRKTMKLKAGEMLFYESARLIHGRPKVFQGKLMANAFLHFKPTTGWLYNRMEDGNLYHDGQNLVKVHPLPDGRTLSSIQGKLHGLVDRIKDEL